MSSSHWNCVAVSLTRVLKKKKTTKKKPIFLHIQGEKGELVATCFVEDKRKMVVGGKNRRDVGNERGCY